jgi:3-oxoacyl-[acyl-carrier protein] reductase
MNGLKNKHVIITGGANGIGRAAAQKFYAEGANLLLIDMPTLEQTELSFQFKDRMTYISGDITTAETREKIKAYATNTGCDVLINNAGITRDSTALKMTEDQWDQVLNVNLKAVFMLSQLAAGVMKEKGTKGCIVNVASVVAHYGNFGQANYVASKAAVIGLTKTMAKELGRAGIRVNAVAPGFIATPMAAQVPEKVIKMMEEKTPLARLGKPEEIAAAFAFLASDDAAYITGTTLNVDGGLVIG